MSEPPSPGVERRATLRLKRYWMSLRHSENGPFFADFRPERNPIPWERCCLASQPQLGTLSFDHLGDAYRAVFALGADRPDEFARLFGNAADALARREPIETEGRRDVGGRQVLYRSILLPFVDLRGSPAYILGAFTSSVS